MYDRILIATDGSELAGKGVTQGLALAGAVGAKVTVLTVSEPWQPIGVDATGAGITEYSLLAEFEKEAEIAGRKTLDAAIAEAAAAGVTAESLYASQRPPADAIIETAEQQHVDLIVMTSHGRRGVQRLLLGSQTNEVLTRSKVPVLVVR